MGAAVRITLAVSQLTKLGGKERDCLATARHLAERGHQVTVLTTAVADDLAAAPFRIELLRVRGFSNHSRSAAFARAVLKSHRQQGGDLLFAFDRMPGADVFFAADRSYLRRYHGLAAKLLPRRRTMLALERGVYDPKAATRLLFLTAQQRDEYQQFYGFDPVRGSVLPMILHDERFAALEGAAERGAVRRELGIPDDATLVLGIGIAARLKGFDRTLAAVAAQPNLHLLLAGSSDRWLAPQVAELGLQDRVRLLPYVPNVMDLLLAADLFVHPAREEAGGIVIGEALLAGLPVIVSAVCGYAPVVARAGAGIVLPEPFTPEALSAALIEVIGALPAFRERASAEAANLRETRGAWLRCIAEQVEAAAATR